MTKQLNNVCTFAVLHAALALFTGCAHDTVRVSLDTYVQQPAAFEGQEVIFTAALDDVLERYGQYKDRLVEVTAPVSYYGASGFWTWHLQLTENNRNLRCYTHHYRIEPGWDAVNLLMRATAQKRAVTVLGTLRKDGIDIRRMSCDGATVSPSYKPPRAGGWWPWY